MVLPLMPKATAAWLVENTALTFEQIAEFCGLHPLEVQAIADGEVKVGLFDPLIAHQLTREEIDRCGKDPTARLCLAADMNIPTQRSKKSKYTPMARRHLRPDAIAWVLKNHPELSYAQIIKLIGTTKNTILAVQNRTHKNTQTIKPRHPVTLGLCKQEDLEAEIEMAKNVTKSKDSISK